MKSIRPAVGTCPEACPICGKPKVWRENRWGELFLGCSSYPECKWIHKKALTCPICHEQYDKDKDPYHLDACRDSIKP